MALSYAAITDQLLGDLPSLTDTLAEVTQLCERYDFAYYRQWATVLSGWATGGAAGLREARHGIERLTHERSLVRMPYWLSLVADLQRRQGNTTAETAALDAAASYATEHDEVWWLPEILRARAALDPRPRGTRRLEQAVELARSQSSRILLQRCRADLAARSQD